MKKSILAIAGLLLIATVSFAGSGNKKNQIISAVCAREFQNLHYIMLAGDATLYYLDGNGAGNKAILATALQAFQNGNLVDIYWTDLPYNPGLLKVTDLIIYK